MRLQKGLSNRVSASLLVERLWPGDHVSAREPSHISARIQ